MSVAAWATHNRAGEITFVQLDDLEFEFTITTYTKTSSVAADRDSLELCFGDGSPCVFVLRNTEVFLPNDIKRNTYTTTHTFPGRATYTVTMTDPNRNAGINNIPNSVNVQFHLFTKLTILNPIFSGSNTSPVLLQPPIDIGYVGQPFVHNPNAYDADGDSVAFEQIIPFQGVNTEIVNYSFPEDYPTPTSATETLNETTGEYIWFVPVEAGEYNIAFLVKEYRNGVLISCIVRDMQVTIEEGQNLPPEIESPMEICVVAGDTVDFFVIATDPDVGQLVELTALGGPLQSTFFQPASFTVATGFQPQPNIGRFFWATECEHIRSQNYQVVFKARDNYRDSLGLSTLKTVLIKVVGPPPIDVQAIESANNIEVSWELPYRCENIDRFRGFSVWRRQSSNPFTPDTCETGLAGRGYTKIADRVTSTLGSRYNYTDTDIQPGRTYCYRVLAEFAELTPAGTIYNFVESIPSNEACVELRLDIPLIINVSVDETDAATGEMFVRWMKPNATELDTISNAPPYRYEVYRSDGQNGPGTALVYVSANAPSFSAANDTFFVDVPLDTETKPYTYVVEFFAEDTLSLGRTSIASSILLEIASTDRTNFLTWTENVPWQNDLYVIHRQDPGATVFLPIDTVTVRNYTDGNLINELEYCYFIESLGSYNQPTTPDTLINFSQENCGIPIDTVAPCAPMIMVENICDTDDQSTSPDQFVNTITWSAPDPECAYDVAAYNIYYVPNEGQAFTQADIIQTITNGDTIYLHQLTNTVAGCYAVTAIDTVGNESELSNTFCVDNCPLYELPNAFTPNGDGANDFFKPFPYRFVDRIDIKIFNRWGNLVFETNDPDILWNGKNLSGQDLNTGVYFYVCEVFEDRVGGEEIKPIILEGYIQLFRGQ